MSSHKFTHSNCIHLCGIGSKAKQKEKTGTTRSNEDAFSFHNVFFKVSLIRHVFHFCLHFDRFLHAEKDTPSVEFIINYFSLECHHLIAHSKYEEIHNIAISDIECA